MKKSTGKKARQSKDASLEALLEEITVDAHGEHEQLWAFRQAFEDHVRLPSDGSVVGGAVTVLAFEYDGNERRGLTATCRTDDGREYVVAAADLTMPEDSEGARYLAAYRQWMGLSPITPRAATARQKRKPADIQPVLAMDSPVELMVLSLTPKAARCRVLGTGREVTVRATRLWDVVPGMIAVIEPGKRWTYAGHPYLSGTIASARLDVSALGLVPLKLEDRGIWNPADHYWGEEGDPIENWAKPIIARGNRPEFEMEQVLPGMDPEDPFSDPITESNDLKDSGDRNGAEKILMDLCQADLRCLDAHAHLGNLAFHSPEDAIRHYEVGVRIGELSLGKGFDGVLLWGMIDNRPFLRCMHGLGLCLWRLGRFKEAGRLFDRMLWLNPSDNQGVRFLIGEVRAKIPWRDHDE